MTYRALIVALFSAVVIFRCEAQRNCREIRNNPDAVPIVTACQRQHMPARIIEIVTECASESAGIPITLEEFMIRLCNDDPDDLPRSSSCFENHLLYIMENAPLIEESGKRAEECAKERLGITEK